MALLSNNHSKNIIYTLSPGLISIFITFFSIPIFLNYIENNIYADYLIKHFLLTISTILSLQFGKISSIKMQLINSKYKNDFVLTSIFFSTMIGIVLSCIIFLILNIIFKNFNLIKIDFSILVGFAITIIYINLEYIGRGLGFFKATSFTNLIFYSISISLPGIMIFTEFDRNFIINNLFNISLIIKFISLNLLVVTLFDKDLFFKSKIKIKLINKFIFHSKWMTITAVYNQIYEYLDKHLIKIFMGPSMLIIYSVPQQIAAKLSIISSAIISVILPKLSSLKMMNHKKIVFSANLYLFIYVIGLGLLIILPFLEYILKWWLEDGYKQEMLYLIKLFFLLTFLGSCSNIIISLYETNSIEKKNTILESYSIFPFLISLILCVYFKNILFFAIALLFKEIILLLIRINEIKKFIINFKYLIIQIVLFNLIFLFNLIKNNYLVFLFITILIFLTIFNFPLKIIKNEFKKK
ncbi:hypothetical protein OA187_04365 [Candidatus Pelagibacter sp.]|nr:hypothetical protein [Candidatus Pelagibacter sp.]